VISRLIMSGLSARRASGSYFFATRADMFELGDV
jgi:hypothetical protein